MDYEKNKEALAVVKQMVADGQVAQDVVEKYFPELAEPENERIRKEILHFVTYIEIGKEKRKRWITWLEGQKEPMVKLVFPKFRVGDIVRMKEPKGSDWDRRITYIDDCGYNFDYPDHGGGGCIGFAWEDSFELVEKKPDEKQGEQKPIEWSQEDLICLGYLADFVDKNGDDFYGNNKPNVVKWIRSFAELPTHTSINEIEQKPEWSDEDEKIRKALIDVLNSDFEKDTEIHGITVENIVSWLNRLQPKQEWSEEDEKMYTATIFALAGFMGNENKLEWLKSLKDRVQVQNFTVTDEELAQAKKDAYNDALNKIEYHSGEPTFDDGWNAAIWYLKKKNINFQNTWKPSDEQIGVIEAVINNRSFQRRHLDSLYEQLKKLREE